MTGNMDMNDLPSFLEPVSDLLMESGAQIRLISQVKSSMCVGKKITRIISEIAERERLMCLEMAEEMEDEWATCEAGFGEIGLAHWTQSENSDYFPLPFRNHVIHKVNHVIIKLLLKIKFIDVKNYGKNVKIKRRQN